MNDNLNNLNSEGPEVKERYKLLISARQFHYDNFSKWASYFYVAIGALFVAYYSIVANDKIENPDKLLLGFVVLILGFLCSMLWYWSTKGYYYWNINFISLVNHYESNVFKWEKEERVYYVHANRKEQNKYESPIHGANISTSKVAIFFSYIVTTAWGFLLFYKLFSLIWPNDSRLLITLSSILLAIFFILILSISIGRGIFYSKIDHFPDLELKQESIK